MIIPRIYNELYDMSSNRKIKEKRWSNNTMKPDELYPRGLTEVSTCAIFRYSQNLTVFSPAAYSDRYFIGNR